MTKELLRRLYICRNLRNDEVMDRGTVDEKTAVNELVLFFKDVGQQFDVNMTIGQNIGTIFYR